MNVGTAGLVRSKALRIVYTREKPPSASTGPVVEKSSNQPNSSGAYGRPKAIVGAAPFSAFTVSGKAPFTLPTLTVLVPKFTLRFFVSSAAEASAGNDSSR